MIYCVDVLSKCRIFLFVRRVLGLRKMSEWNIFQNQGNLMFFSAMQQLLQEDRKSQRLLKSITCILSI